MKIVLASRNTHKIREWQQTLCRYIDGVEMLSLDDVGIYEDIEEDGETFEENAKIKALSAAQSGYISVGEDSGLSVSALGGAPGVYSARYSGGHGNHEENNKLLLKNLQGKADRSAKFVCTVCCVFPESPETPEFFTGETEGRITEEYLGQGGFGYDPLFYYEPKGKTFAQLSAEEKNEISHRGKAIAMLAKRLSQIKEN